MTNMSIHKSSLMYARLTLTSKVVCMMFRAACCFDEQSGLPISKFNQNDSEVLLCCSKAATLLTAAQQQHFLKSGQEYVLPITHLQQVLLQFLTATE